MYLHTLTGAQLEDATVASTAPLVDALRSMNATALRLVVVTQPETGHFVGVLADGDVRRWLAQPNGNKQVTVAEVMNATPIVTPIRLSPQEARELLNRKGVEYLPWVAGSRPLALYALVQRRPSLRYSAVIMAGGLGTRLRPLTDNCPKPLLSLGGKPIIGHIVDHLSAVGIADFTICINYLGDMIVDSLGDGSERGTNIRYIREGRRLGTGGALSLLSHEISDPFLVINGDLLTDIDATAAIDEHVAAGRAATMVVKEHAVGIPYGVIELATDGSYLKCNEKPTITFPINAGIYVLSHSALQRIPNETYYDLPDLFNVMASSGENVGTYAHQGRCIDIGTMDEWRRAEQVYSRGEF